MKIAKYLWVLSCLFLSGCPTIHKDEPAPIVINTKPIEEAAKKLDAATKKLEDSQKKVDEAKNSALSKAAAGILGVIKANGENPEGLPKQTVDAEGNIAAKGMDSAGVVIDPQDLSDMLQRVVLKLSGKAEQAEKFYTKVNEDLTKEKELRIKAETDREIALKEKAVASQVNAAVVAKVQAESAANVAGYALKNEALEKALDKKVLRDAQTESSNDFRKNAKILAGLCLCCLILAWVKKSPEAFGAAGASALAAVGFQSLAIYIASPYFLYISIGFWTLITLAIIGLVIYFVAAHRKQILDKANKVAEDALNSQKVTTLDEIHDALNKAKSAMPEAAKPIFELIKDEMSNSSRALIKKMSAEKLEK